ncbi:MAG: glycoside hydrolase family 92 protein [Bacteroidaceae bacterium]|nr:glycoside hydrolase family 92 protein [Bacteroidaceae bacterium]
MKQVLLSLFLLLSPTAWATTRNVAPLARASASSQLDDAHGADCVNDGIIRVRGKGSWASAAPMAFWGEIDFPWVQLDWDNPVNISKVVVYDLPDGPSACKGGELVFDDGSRILVRQIPAGGMPREICFPARRTKSLRFEVTDGDGSYIGLSELEVYEAPEVAQNYTELVDPYIETTRGRYFFFVTGSQPFGMISAAPLTRNKNQGGGGYNYNDNTILGFPQVHAWMLAGLDLMPTTGQVDADGGEQAWKSPFTHAGEVVQPAYHRLFLERYGMWVEQTNTDRASLYRLTFTEADSAHILLNLGGYLSTATMVNAHVTRTTDRRICGYFDTTGRLWGGPDVVRIFFAAEFDRAFASLRPFGAMVAADGDALYMAQTTATPRNEGMSYADAPVAGISAEYAVRPGDRLLLKMTVSYTSLENAENNLTEIPGFDFDATRQASQREWNDMLGRIDVKGGTAADRTKFYTDLWHTLLGRHKLDDLSGDYPSLTSASSPKGEGSSFQRHYAARLKIRNLHSDGSLPLGMGGGRGIYNSDALWLSQWNLNTLWGIAYPDVLDDFAASFLQSSLNGGLLARGPCAGGYTFIMSGCPATSLITSAYQRGIHRKYSPKIALREMVRNHEVGGMLAYGQDDDLRFYEQKGYVPNAAGLTIQWAFEDWALAEMAERMGQKKIARRFHRRASGWPASFNQELGFILPRTREGGWLHTDLLNGWGYEEANAWQATFGLSHDIPGLAALMGGNDTLCARLNYAFEQAASEDFMSGYGGGYVSYSNQPGLSNAHVFGHAGRPDLTQYWVRRVRRQAYGGITPDKGYGGHDEDQGQMGSLSALMSIGLFAIDGGSSQCPAYDITSPIFDEVTIRLHPDYCDGREFRILTHHNSEANCYIQRMTLNGAVHPDFRLTHEQLQRGGTLEMWLSDEREP